MKLYGTVESERASKGQGGNKRLYIKIQAGSVDRAEILRLELESTGDGKGKFDRRIAWLSGDMVFLRALRAEIGRVEREYREHGLNDKTCSCVGCEKPSCGRYLDGGALCSEHAAEADGVETKGKRQKGEKCRHCEEYTTDGIFHECPDNK